MPIFQWLPECYLIGKVSIMNNCQGVKGKLPDLPVALLPIADGKIEMRKSIQVKSVAPTGE
jgi:hypothetical protein